MSLGCYATYNGKTFDHVAWTLTHTAVMESGTLVGYDKSYEIPVFLPYADFAAYSHSTTGKQAIIDALNKPGQTLTIKDPSGNNYESFGAADVIDDGPFVEVTEDQQSGYSVWLTLRIHGNIESESSTTTLADEYTDQYSYDEQDRRTYTRRGTRRVSTAWSDIKAALTSVDPAPAAADWELTGKDGTLDEDKKKLDYSFSYIEPFEALPSGFKSFSYAVSESADGRKKDITLTASGGVDFNSGDNSDGIKDAIAKWGKGKIGGAKIVSIDVSHDTRNGTASLSIRAVDKVQDDIVEFSESVTTRKNQDYVIVKTLGGGGGWKEQVGDPDIVISTTGRKVGLTEYPKVSQSGDSSEYTEEEPYAGPDGKLLYPISYSHEYVVIGGESHGNAGGGGGAVAGGGSGVGAGQSNGKFGTPNRVTFGDSSGPGVTPGFATWSG